VAGWTLVCWVVIFWRLSYLPLLDPDEAHYAQITREMVRAGQWLVPTLEGVPLIDKPVLFHWIQGLSFWIFGETEFAARLPTALSALALIWTIYWFGRRLFTREIAERAALMLIITPLAFELSSVAVFDMLFTTFLFGAFAFLVVAAVEGRWWLQVPAALCLSLAVQIKGPVAFVLIALALGLAALFPQTRVALRRLHWFKVFVAAGLLAMPWFLWMWIHFGERFINDYVFYNNISLFAAPLYRRRFYPFFYVRVFATAFFPWSVICVARLVDMTWARRWRTISAQQALLWTWCAVVFGFFTASRFKLDTYIFPLAPAACLLAACAWQDAVTGDAKVSRVTRVSLLVVALLLIAIGVVAVMAYVSVDLRLPRWSLVIPVAAIGGGAAWGAHLLMRRLTPSRYGLPLIATLLFVYGGIVLFGFPAYAHARPVPRLAQRLASVVRPTDRVAVYKQERWKASLRFYSKQPVLQIETMPDLRKAWDGPDRVFCVMVGRDADTLGAAGFRIRITDHELGIIGTTGRGIRQQVWGDVVVATNR
jgi:4-amino-4-deoxy-L-arabinose transferase-like glycosyltransferase